MTNPLKTNANLTNTIVKEVQVHWAQLRKCEELTGDATPNG